MVSLDGFRYDYAKKYGAKHLLALGAQGAIAGEGMIPSYPSLTFPNHYTLVTGLYPEHHGIVANSFYDPIRKQRYSLQRSGHQHRWKLVRRARRYGCWRRSRVCAARASSGPGSEAEIDGGRPTYYLKFDDHFPDAKRIDQVIAWLRMPADAAAALHHALLLERRSCRPSIRPRQPADRRRG